jgi:hypothetical protein
MCVIFFSGVDVVALLESMNASEKIMGLVKNSSTGYLAITYALYKIATPARYAVTVGKYYKQLLSYNTKILLFLIV